ncbi:MAG: SUMF1/EgtB/PvdO family nonheme iron enzyme [Deltaproteobacteria bacterium]|nr:SUMF1/EgtB/PvdO family nonheme iron enzyme [Deltaproteobacteria bacterium]
MRRARGWPLVVLVVVPAIGGISCVSDRGPLCAFSCDDGICPEGFECRADAYCHVVGTEEPCEGFPESCSSSCPQDMAPVSVAASCVCVDRFEASQGDGGAAASRYGAGPWVNVTWEGAKTACELAGKRLCAEEEWLPACAGPSGSAYPYGDDYDPGACNVYGTGEQGTVVPAGSMVTCAGGYPGLFDMSGNVWEWTSTCTTNACRARGGSFNVADDESDLSCAGAWEADPADGQQFLGFRCCLTP